MHFDIYAYVTISQDLREVCYLNSSSDFVAALCNFLALARLRASIRAQACSLATGAAPLCRLRLRNVSLPISIDADGHVNRLAAMRSRD